MKYKSLLLFFVLILSVINISGTPSNTIDQERTDIETDQSDITVVPNEPGPFAFENTMDIDVVFIGFDESNIDINDIDSNITKHYAPRVTLLENDLAGANYSLNLDYHFSNSTDMEDDFINFLYGHGVFTQAPAQLANYDAGATQAYYFDAHDTHKWLDNNVNTYFNEKINETYTMYLIDTYTWDYITEYYYYYFLDFADTDTGYSPGANFTHFYGGNSRSIFFDLSAGPVYYEDTRLTEDDEGVSDDTIPPIWEYAFPNQAAIDLFNDNLNEYIQETIDLVFTPSYIMDFEYRSDLSIEIVLFDDATGSYADNINTTTVDEVYESFLPFTDTIVTKTITTMANYPELQTFMDNNNDGGSIDAIELRDYMLENRSDFGVGENSIPVYIWAWDDSNKWVAGTGTLGIALPDNQGNPAVAMMGYNPNHPATSIHRSGYTQTIIHEVGHLMGLRHPHDGYSYDRLNDTGNPDIKDWLRDFVSSPMGYAHEDITFSIFDRDQIHRGYAMEAAAKTLQNLYEANNTLMSKDINSDDFDSAELEQLQMYLEMTTQNYTISAQNMTDFEYLGAFYQASLALDASQDYLELANDIEALPDDTSPSDDEPVDLPDESEDEDSGILGFPFYLPVVVIVILILYRTRKNIKV